MPRLGCPVVAAPVRRERREGGDLAAGVAFCDKSSVGQRNSFRAGCEVNVLAALACFVVGT